MNKGLATALLLWATLAGLPAAWPDTIAGVTYQLDPTAIIQGRSNVETDLPTPSDGVSYFTGSLPLVNNLVGADRFYSAGITGSGTITANVEAGYIWGGPSGHNSLPQVTNIPALDDSIGEVDRHATWVGMIIGGQVGGSVRVGDWQKGIAPGTNLYSGALANSWSGTAYSAGGGEDFNVSVGALLDTYNAAFGTADVINSSWGITDPTGTNWRTIPLDAFARARPHTTFVTGAGNGGPLSNSVTGPGSGYNAITVGSLANNGSNQYNAVSDFSGRGPQNYSHPGKSVLRVRATVDLVAPGEEFVSAFYGGQTGGNGMSLSGSTPGLSENWRYTVGLGGTSFSSAVVAGGVALLDNASKAAGMSDNARDARVLRAVLMNSADKLSGWSNGQVQNLSTLVISTTQSLDWATGAGALNLSRAYDQYLSGTAGVSGGLGGAISYLGWDLGQVSSVGQHNDYVFNTSLKGGSMMDVTLSWFRNRSVDVAGLTSSDDGYANLDLEVWDSTFTTLYATSDSLYNSSEELHFALPQDGSYGLRVVYQGQQFGTATTESYGLAWSASAVPEPSTVSLLVAGIIGLLVGCRRIIQA